MKKRVILISFVAVIATGIAILYIPQKSNVSTSATQSGEDSTQPHDQNTNTIVEGAPTSTGEQIALPIETTTSEPVTTPAPAPVAPIPVVTKPPVPTVVKKNVYANGTYSSTLPYKVPEGGNESITVSLTLKDDVVTSMTYSASGNKEESQKYQGRFGKSVEALVIGEPISGISLSRVGGASLTSRAFNKAVLEIQAEAQAQA
jgi:cytoskeletal protein RodZ